LTVSSSVTSPGAAIAVPPLRSILAMHASIDSLDTSLTATFAPYLASARAMPLPMFGPHPVTSATLPSSETSNAYRHLSLFLRPCCKSRAGYPVRERRCRLCGDLARPGNRLAGQKFRHLAWGMHQLLHVTRETFCILAAGAAVRYARLTRR
jgi:hypothetical protein